MGMHNWLVTPLILSGASSVPRTESRSSALGPRIRRAVGLGETLTRSHATLLRLVRGALNYLLLMVAILITMIATTQPSSDIRGRCDFGSSR
ncbi:hypothetical protein BDM02DRAFT_2074485 [Thelephora ganbajun]|uniref:Uncharacterized protein n=1 Tax=Thelephora ganbajun TaxID=370292 RepID=A0ACB6ZHF9_THEGA|nr:hypothetical protein BDM02DRAFT_2074485 [Thelephora ganbajun]